MSVLATVLAVLAAWLSGALVVGVLVGTAIRRRDRQIPTPPDAASTSGPGLAAVGGDGGSGRSVPGRGRRVPVARDQEALRHELERLLAELDRTELHGGPDDMADLHRIWAARAAAARAERELNRAIEQARVDGHPWETIKIVLELPPPEESSDAEVG